MEYELFQELSVICPKIGIMIRKNGMIAITGLGIILGVSSCGNDTNKSNTLEKDTVVSAPVTADTMKHEDTAKAVEETPKVTESPDGVGFTAWPLKKVDTAVKAFKAKYKGDERWMILALNRLDEANIKRADTLIIPKNLLSDFKQYSPFPASMPSLKDVNKIVVFSYAIQAFAAYEHGELVIWGPTSMGSKIHPTPTGLHFTNWKGKEITSTVDDEWKLKWNFNIANKEGVGWHQYAMPGYPASHSCLRLLEKQAMWMYDWADQWILQKGGNTVLAQGTPVIVYGAYPFGHRRPWLNQLNDPNATNVSEADLDKEIQPFLQRIMEQQERRAQVKQGTPTTTTAAKDTATSAQ
jgi:lipoprotein-anchoring transpeptidase ErfK/SrfK